MTNLPNLQRINFQPIPLADDSFWGELQQEFEIDSAIFESSEELQNQIKAYKELKTKEFCLSFYAQTSVNVPEIRLLTSREILALCEKPQIRANKNGMLLSGAKFKPNTTRANENVDEISIVGLDFDHDADWETDLQILRDYNIAFAAYTSHSHLRCVAPVKGKTRGNPNAEPRFRVFIFLTQPIPASKYPALFKFFFNLTGKKIDTAASDSSRMFFAPAKATQDAPYNYQEFIGEPFDWTAIDLPEDDELKVEAKTTGAKKIKRNEDVGEPPENKLRDLIEFEPKFRASWNRNRAELDDNNQSSIDMSLSNYAVLAYWTDKEILSLLVKSRGDFKRNERDEIRWDYYERTISEARRWAATLESSDEHQNVELLESAKPDQSILNVILDKPQKEEKSTKQIRDVGIKKEYSDAICETDSFAVDAGGLLYVYKNGVYVPEGKRHIEARVKSIANERNQTKVWSSHLGREIAAYISTGAQELQEKPPLNIINVKNGLLYVDLATGEHHLEPHTPTHLSTIQLPVEFDEQATADEWIKFIETTFPDDAKELAWQIVAWLMIPYTSIQKSVLLVGEGSNGKSVYLTALKSFLGRKNVSNMTLQKLENERFAVANLLGKLANICPDLPSLKLENSSVFKSIVGGDTIVGEHKNERQFEFTPFVRLVFAANHLPQSNDSSFAFFRRFLVLPFTRTIAESEQIAREILDARLSDSRQLSGVLNQALKALPRLIKNGLIESASMREAKQEFRELTDPLAIWLERNCILGSDCYVEKSKLLFEYNKDNQKHKRPTITQHSFTKAINRLYPQLGETQKTIGGNRPMCWTGIGLLEL